MPRKAKDKEEIIEEKKKTATKKTSTKTKATTKKASATKAKATTAKKASATKAKATTAKKTSTTKVKATTAKKASTTKAKATTAKKASATKTKTTTAKKASTTKAKATTTKKASATKTKATTAKKTSTTKAKTTAAKKASTTKAKATTAKKTSTTKSKNTATKKASTAKKTSTRTRKKAEIVENIADTIEYYDLPYRYNETVVKVLAQTPNILFIYWDISDNDKQNFINTYGEFFFNDTKPVLVIHNDTMHYSFEIDINDFANSWYLEVNDSNCDYRVELGRRPINEYAKINDYLYVASSNEIGSPNDHILFDSLNDNVYFKNVKTNSIYSKDISLWLLKRIGKLYNIKDFYKLMYKDEDIDFDRLNLKNMPSS